MTVGEVAKQMGVTVRTLQYYDREGLLKPSGCSGGGRRLYSSKDLVKLHQILSFKYLGFSLEEIKSKVLSLDTPQEVAAILEQQGRLIERQIEDLQSALRDIRALQKEVLDIQKVDFKKYAEIIDLLRMGNKEYWVWKLFDDTLSDHIQNRILKTPELGEKLMESYQYVLNEALMLKRKGSSPESAQSMQMAKKWWDMIMDFTGGDLNLLPKLVQFNENKVGWKKEIAEKQEEIDEYIGAALDHYFYHSGINIPKIGDGK